MKKHIQYNSTARSTGRTVVRANQPIKTVNSKRKLLLALIAPLLLAFLAPATHAAILQYDAFLSGPNESPPNASPGTGFATVSYDTAAHTLLVPGEALGGDSLGPLRKA